MQNSSMSCYKIKPASVLFYGICLILLILVICLITLASVPPVSRDALVHHLAVPKLYIDHGKMVELPCMPYSYYPMNLDLLYLMALKFGSDLLPKYIHCIFGLMTAGLLYLYLSIRIKPVFGVIGSLLFLSLPIIVRLCITAYVDLGLVFFTTASVLSMLAWKKKGGQYLILSAVFCGLALGTKYNGLLVFFILSLFLIFICIGRYSDRNHRYVKTITTSLLFAMVAIAVYSPWMIRNVQWTGNPFHPLFSNISTEKVRNECEIETETEFNSIRSYNHFQYRYLFFNENLPELLLLPLRIFFQGQDNSEQYFDGKLSALLLLLPFFAFSSRARIKNYDAARFEKHFFLWFSIFYVLIIFLVRPVRIRYFAPSFPFLVILSVYGLQQLVANVKQAHTQAGKKLYIGLLILCIGYSVVLSARYINTQLYKFTPVQYFRGKIKREDYIAKFRPEYRLFQYINANLPQNTKILFFYIGKRGYYSDREYIPDQGGNLNWILHSLQQEKSVEAVSDRLKEKGITHLFINHILVKKRIDQNPEKMNKFINFLHKSTTILKISKGYSLYSLD